jgi:ADP-ribose pyrophosphatase YjhB (NUDIX family)
MNALWMLQRAFFFALTLDTNMNSFSDFLDERLRQDVSKEGQIAQYEKSLRSLFKVRKRLVANGMNTTDIDNQMNDLNKAMRRRLSGVHKWHGDIVRIDQEPINNTPMWKLSTNNDLVFHIPTKDTAGVIKIPVNWHQYPNPRKPMTKFIEYRQEIFGYNMVNLITYTENRTVDVVPVRTNDDQPQYYLIKRQDSGLWATVGGHIDEGELENPILAARRELREETTAEPLVLRQLPSGWVKEVVANPDETPSKEYNSWTLPFIAIISPTTVMDPQSDAAGGNWFSIGSVPEALHFTHHKEILRKAFDFLPILLKQFGKH